MYINIIFCFRYLLILVVPLFFLAPCVSNDIMPYYNYVIFFQIQSWWSYDSGRLIPVFVRSPWHKTNNLYGFTHLIIMNYIKLNNYLAFTFLTKIYQE